MLKVTLDANKRIPTSGINSKILDKELAHINIQKARSQKFYRRNRKLMDLNAGIIHMQKGMKRLGLWKYFRTNENIFKSLVYDGD